MPIFRFTTTEWRFIPDEGVRLCIVTRQPDREHMPERRMRVAHSACRRFGQTCSGEFPCRCLQPSEVVTMP